MSYQYTNILTDIYPERFLHSRMLPGKETLAVSPDLLPPGFGTAHHTIERVSDSSPMVELMRVVEWVDDSLNNP